MGGTKINVTKVCGQINERFNVNVNVSCKTPGEENRPLIDS